jgi:hypothetical protein
MSQTLNLGRRIELLPMDKHCHDISVGLYRELTDAAPRYVVHTYSSVAGSRERVGFLTRALLIMAGMHEVAGAPGWLRFACDGSHERALRRGFLDLCKLETGAPLDPKPLTVFDKKAECNLEIHGLGAGVYEIRPEGGTPDGSSRAAALAGGFVKLCEMEAVEGSDPRIAFPCKASHDALMGLLAFRAQNVRASLREQEAAASRGILAAPSQQK